jgi:uncharacterized protein (TIGR02996 family)
VESTQEAAFLAGIRAEPKDDLRRLVYADWLDERGDEESRTKAEYLRLEVDVSGLAADHPERDGHNHTLRNLAERIPVEWKTIVVKVPIENCGALWRFQCPKKWDQLEETENHSPEVRFCSACREYVVYCASVDMARSIAETMGHCVVIDPGVRRDKHDMDRLRPPPVDYSGSYPGPSELDILFGIGPPPSVREPPPPPDQSKPGFFRRVWRKLTGR